MTLRDDVRAIFENVAWDEQPKAVCALIEAAITDEREACAKIADTEANEWGGDAQDPADNIARDAADNIAKAIRARHPTREE